MFCTEQADVRGFSDSSFRTSMDDAGHERIASASGIHHMARQSRKMVFGVALNDCQSIRSEADKSSIDTLQVGKDGVITVEESKTLGTEVDIVEGMQFERGYLSSYMVTDTDKMEAVIENPYILITDKKITQGQELVPILEQVSQAGGKLLVIAEDVEGEALAVLVVNKIRGLLDSVAVKAPGFGDRRKEMLRDIGILTGGTVILAFLACCVVAMLFGSFNGKRLILRSVLRMVSSFF